MRLVIQYTRHSRVFNTSRAGRGIEHLGSCLAFSKRHCAFWLRAPQNQHTSIFNSHLNLKIVWALNIELSEH